jgi:hypothetical protein
MNMMKFTTPCALAAMEKSMNASHPNRPTVFRHVAAVFCLTCVSVSTVPAQPPVLSELLFLPGDAEFGPAIQDQNDVKIARGGAGYLAVWTDKRAVLDGLVSQPGSKLSGNMLDIYGQLLDLDGNPVGDPIVICNEGRNQQRPSVAWNGSAWLVAFEGDRPDWYFDKNIYAVRVAADGTVLDPDPILLFEHTSGQGAYYPAVASDGENWLVICDQWFGSPLMRTVRGRRIAPDGALLEAQPVNMIQSSALTQPDVAFADADAGVYLIAIKSASNDVIYTRRFNAALEPLDALTQLGPGWWTSQAAVGSSGSRFMVIGEKAHRIEPSGQVLDPAGIPLSFTNYRDVAWTGGSSGAWAVAGRVPDPPGVGIQRIADDGSVIDAAPIAVQCFQNQERVSVAGSGQSDAQVVFTDRLNTFDDVSSFRLNGDGEISAHQVIGVGLPRQAHVRMTKGPGGVHMAVFASTANDKTSVLAQRLDANGTPIDAEPTIVTADVPALWLKPDVAFNGEVYLVVWALNGSAVGKRLSADNVVLDPDPITILNYPSIPGHTSGAGAVAAAGATFVVGGFHYIGFNQPVRYVETARLNGTGKVLDPTPVFVAGGFAREMSAASFGDKAILVWGQFSTHDSQTAFAQTVIVDGTGTMTGPFAVSQSGRGKHPNVAVGHSPGSPALVVWHDDATIHQDDISGRFVNPDGTMPAGQFLISGAPNQQMFPAVGWDGEQYVVAWNDYRHISGIEQSRADIYAARVLPDGAVLDPDGFPVADKVLPEDLAGVSGANGRLLIMFSALHGLNDVPEIQRLGYRVLGEPSVPGDLNGDGVVGVADLLILLANWGACPDCNNCPADLDGDCNVGVADLLILLANWG